MQFWNIQILSFKMIYNLWGSATPNPYFQGVLDPNPQKPNEEKNSFKDKQPFCSAQEVHTPWRIMLSEEADPYLLSNHYVPIIRLSSNFAHIKNTLY